MRTLLVLALAASAATAQTIYVASSGGSTISVFDSRTNSVKGQIAVAGLPLGMAASADGLRLYVTSVGGTLEAIDRKTMKVLRNVTVGPVHTGVWGDVAISSNGRELWVVNPTSVEIIDTAPMTKIRTLTPALRVYRTPDGTRMMEVSKNEISVVNGRTKAKEFGIIVAGATGPVAVESNRSLAIQRIFVATGNSIDVIDYATRKSSGKVAVTAGSLAVAPDQKSLWVLTKDAVQVFSLSDLKLAATIPGTAASVAFTTDGMRAFLSDTAGNALAVVDASTYKEKGRVALSAAPGRLLAAE